MIKKDRIHNYPFAFLMKIDQCAVFCTLTHQLFQVNKEFVDSVLFSRNFSQRLVGDVNG